MDQEFSDFHPVHSDDAASYCQAWEACTERFQYQRNLIEDEDILYQKPYEGESRGYADDATWILTSSFVIFTMQSGFGLLEAGSCSPGFEVNIMMKNVVDVVFSALTYYLVGYGISFGRPSTPFMGKGNFPADGGYDEVMSGILYSKYIFQLSFAATSTTIVSGCVAMRLKFFIYVLYSLISVIFYSFVAHWVFDPTGWLYAMGAHDFAGGAPVHVFGGINGLVAVIFLGPRKGRFDGTRPLSDFFPSSPTSQCFGLLALWWGWIGFNCGSSFGITDDRWVVAIRCAVTTINSTVAGGVTSMAYTLLRTNGKYIIPDHMINGILGSLVAITPACGATNTWAAFPIGSVGALVGLGCNTLICRLHLDDPVGAIGVHAGSGIWGLLSVGLFADSKLPGIEVDDGLFLGGGFKLLGLQILATVVTIGWALMWSTFFFYTVGVCISRDLKNPRAGLRVHPEEEERGADWFLHGVTDSTAFHNDTVNCSDEERSSSSSDDFFENGTTQPPKQEPAITSVKSVLVGNFDDLASVKEIENGNCDGDGNEEVGVDSSNRSSDRGSTHEAKSRHSFKSKSSRRESFVRANTGVLGHSAISHYSPRDPRALTRPGLQTMQRSSASRKLEIYR